MINFKKINKKLKKSLNNETGISWFKFIKNERNNMKEQNMNEESNFEYTKYRYKIPITPTFKLTKKEKKKYKKYLKYNFVYCVQKIEQKDGGGYRVWIPQLGSELFQEHGDTVDEALGRLEFLKEDLFKEYIIKGIKIKKPKQE